MHRPTVSHIRGSHGLAAYVPSRDDFPEIVAAVTQCQIGRSAVWRPSVLCHDGGAFTDLVATGAGS